MKTLSAIVLAIAGIACAGGPAFAADAPAKQVKKAPAKKKQPAKPDAAEHDDGKEPDVGGMTPVAFDCELGNKLTIYNNAGDDQQIALRWNKRLHQMTRVSTTTGAHRFEDSKNGLVWIGIPAKGMLLDAKKGKQLANECRNAEQAAQVAEKN
ncbi:MAG TPA: hypothetical protein VIM12_04440 [Noviherbaspirillum sp.]|jgi:hypothetical protein|uniref:hypothetical protein n=1 Tax=Noviherbaspirillum sp. TaxID=1926288 RepID=UPI002F959ABE